MSRFTGVVRAVRRGVRAGARLLKRRYKPVTSGNAAGWVRRAGRWLLVRGLASAAFRPGRWGAGLAVVGLAVPGPWWIASIAVVPFGIYRWASRSSVGGILTILSTVSSRVKSLRVRRALLQSWTPLMRDLGFSKEMYRRPRSKPWQPARMETVVPRLGRIKLGDWSVSVSVDLRLLNLGASSLQKVTERIESGVSGLSGLSGLSCTIVKIGPGLATVDLQHTDPLDRAVTTADLPQPRRHLHVVTGLDESGRGVERDLVLPQLVVGAQGSGKSSEAWMLLYAIQQAGIPCRVRAFDPKGGMELGELADAAYAYESDPSAWPRFLGSALGALRKRQTDLAEQQVRKLTQFTDQEPLDLMLIDELIAILDIKSEVNYGGRTMRADDAMRLYLSQARAAGHTVIALSQLGHADVIGRIRPLFSHATCMRVGAMEAAMVDVVLGSKDAHKNFPAHLIPPGKRFAGVGYTRLETAVRRYRAAYLSDEQRAGVVARMRADTARFRNARKPTTEKVGATA